MTTINSAEAVPIVDSDIRCTHLLGSNFLRVLNEEMHRIKKFGDEYREYMKRTGRFLPKLGS